MTIVAFNVRHSSSWIGTLTSNVTPLSTPVKMHEITDNETCIIPVKDDPNMHIKDKFVYCWYKFLNDVDTAGRAAHVAVEFIATGENMIRQV